MYYLTSGIFATSDSDSDSDAITSGLMSIIFEILNKVSPYAELALSFLVIFTSLSYKTIKHIEFRKAND